MSGIKSNKSDVIYRNIISKILSNGVSDSVGEVRPKYADGTPAHSLSIFGYQAEFEPGELPIITLKKTPVQSSINEVVHAFFIQKTSNVKDFEELGIGYWGEWAKDNGSIGLSYGRQLARQTERFEIDGHLYELDQVNAITHRLKNDPFSRRIMFSYWNPKEVHHKSLQECAYTGQFNVRPDENGDLQLDFLLVQRSVDVLLGLPSNWAGYYALQCAMASAYGFKVGRFVHQMGNVHLYDNQLDMARELIANDSKELPEIYVNPEVKEFMDFKVGDIKYQNYKSAGSYRTNPAI